MLRLDFTSTGTFLQEAFKKKANNLDWIDLLLLQESCKDLYWIALAEWIILV